MKIPDLALLLKSRRQVTERVTPDFAIPVPVMSPSKPAVYPDQVPFFVAPNRPVVNRADILAVGRSGDANSVGAIGGANLTPAETAAPDAPGSPSFADVDDFWNISWTIPYDSTSTTIFSRVKLMLGSDEITEALWTASATAVTEWAEDWMRMPPGVSWAGYAERRAGFISDVYPAVTGDVQFAVRYKNDLGNIGPMATASASIPSTGDFCTYIADLGNNRVVKYDTLGKYFNHFGSYGSGAGQFLGIYTLTKDNEGFVYVCDTTRNNIQKFRGNNCTYATAWGGTGTATGKFNFPADIAFGASATALYVTDYLNSRVQEFTTAGAYVTSIGEAGTGNGQFGHPSCIAVGPDSSIYVTDDTLSRITRFDKDGAYVGKWGSYGYGDSEFVQAAGIACDSAGNVYVSDSSTRRIQKFDEDGVYLTAWGGWGFGLGKFQVPMGVTVGVADTVLIADQQLSTVQAFTTAGDYLYSYSSPGPGPLHLNWPNGIEA